ILPPTPSLHDALPICCTQVSYRTFAFGVDDACIEPVEIHGSSVRHSCPWLEDKIEYRFVRQPSAIFACLSVGKLPRRRSHCSGRSEEHTSELQSPDHI